MELDDLRGRTLEDLMTDYRQRLAMPTIRKIAEKMPYLEARKIAAPEGGLPRNAFSKQALVDSDAWQRIAVGYFPAWQRELLVHPESGESFKKGEDVTETFESKGTTFTVTYPAYCIPEEARKQKTALFVDPKHEPAVEGNDIIVNANPYKEVTVLEDFPQKNGWGRVDKATGIPLTYKNVDDLPSGEQGYLWRVNAQGVRPLVRYYGDVGGRVVYANWGFDDAFGVGVESREAAPQISASKLTLGQLLDGLQKT
jgi:hypothetical protein